MPAPASTSRSSVADLERRGPVGRHRGVRQRPGDLARSRGRAPPLRPRRPRSRGRAATWARRRRAPRRADGPGVDHLGLRLAADDDGRPGGRHLGLDPDAGQQLALVGRSESRAPRSRSTRVGRNATRAGSGSVGVVSTRPGERPRRRPTRRAAARRGPPRCGPGGPPGPSRTGGWPPSGARIAGRSAGSRSGRRSPTR